MSMLNKVVAAVFPPESNEARAEARAKAQATASAGDWLSVVLEHHRQIEGAFAAVKAATPAATRMAAQQELAVLLTGRSIAEEAGLTPALRNRGWKIARDESLLGAVCSQTQMALLETIPPMSQDYLDNSNISVARSPIMCTKKKVLVLRTEGKAASCGTNPVVAALRRGIFSVCRWRAREAAAGPAGGGLI